MSLTVAYAGLAAGLMLWIFLVLRLRAKPWEAELAGQGDLAADTPTAAPARIGLWVFLAVVTSLFGLFISAYFIRMGHLHAEGQGMGDWRPVTEPTILWANTAALILASVAMQWARVAAARAQADRMRLGLMVGGALTLVFLAGQINGWRELSATQYASPGDPAVAFFYVLTVVHALHLLGGLYVWNRTLGRLAQARRSPNPARLAAVRLSVELCTFYWHYLLLVWLVLYALLLST